MAMNRGTVLKVFDFAQDDLSSSLAFDKIAGDHLVSQTLKLIYETMLNLAYGLFIVGLTISLSVSQTTRNDFIDYVKAKSSAGYLVVIVFLAIFNYTLDKACSKDKKYAPKTKKKINFLESTIKGVIFALILIFISQFVRDHYERTEIVVAYWLYILAMILFKVIYLIKWYYYFCGPGKEDFSPWQNTLIVDIAYIPPEIQDLLHAVIQKQTKAAATGEKFQIDKLVKLGNHDAKSYEKDNKKDQIDAGKVKITPDTPPNSQRNIK